MLYLKACPRCRGDVKYERDMYGKYLECLQCGFLLSAKNEAPAAAATAEPEQKARSSKRSTKAA